MADNAVLDPSQKAELNANLNRLIAKGKALYLKKITASLELEKQLTLKKRAREKRVEELDKEIAALETQKMGVEAPFIDDLKEVEAKMALIIAELKSGVATDAVEIGYTSHGISVTYDYKGMDQVLEGLQETDKDLWERISEFRREVPKKPTIKIVWK